jgi:hypothetical protein
VLESAEQPGLATLLAQHVRHLASHLKAQSFDTIVAGRALQSALETSS